MLRPKQNVCHSAEHTADSWKIYFFILISNFTEVCTHWQLVNISSENGMAPSRHQATARTNVDEHQWYHMASIGHSVLTGNTVLLAKYLLHNFYHMIFQNMKTHNSNTHNLKYLQHLKNVSFWFQRIVNPITILYIYLGSLGKFHPFNLYRYVSVKRTPGGHLNKKDGLTRYGDSHVKDKTS